MKGNLDIVSTIYVVLRPYFFVTLPWNVKRLGYETGLGRGTLDEAASCHTRVAHNEGQGEFKDYQCSHSAYGLHASHFL